LEQATSGSQGDCAAKHYLKASVYREEGLLDSALGQVRAAIAVHNQALPSDQYSYRYFLAQSLAECGKIDSARQVATSLKQYLEKNGLGLSGYWYAEGCIKTAEDHPDQAAVAFEQSVHEFDAFYSQYLWANALLASGQFETAVRVLTSQLDKYAAYRRHMPIWSVRCHYLLGIACEESRRPVQAIEQYRIFLGLWAEADPDLAALQDARARLARLVATP
jgi:tetratricopeptide (TPR) repeat protein